MLTELETRICTWTNYVSSKLFTIPFQWNNGRLTLKKHQRLFFQALIWIFHTFILEHYCIQLRVAIGKKNVNDFLILAILIIFEAVAAVQKMNIWTYRQEFIQLVNQLLHLNSSWGQTFLEQQFIVFPKREKLFSATTLISISAIWCCFFVTILTRNEGYSWYKLFRLECHWSVTIFSFLLFLIIETFFSLELNVFFMVNMTALYSGCLTMNFWLNKICIVWPKDEAPQHEVCLVRYKGIYILNQDFNVAFGKLLIPFRKLGLVCAIPITLFAVVRLHDDLEPPVVLLAALDLVVGLLVMLCMSLVMSSIFDLSKQFLGNMGPAIQRVTDKKRRSALMRDLKSCALIRCQVGNLYHMEAKARLTWVDIVINSCLFLLINVKK